MSELPVKPPPPPRGEKVELTYDEFSQAVDDVAEIAGPPEIQADPTKGVRGSWDENGNYWQPAKAKRTFSEHCHAITAACLVAILGVLCVSTVVTERRYQKALREVEAVRERLEAVSAESGGYRP